MKREKSIAKFLGVRAFRLSGLSAILLVSLLAIAALAADKLVVKDSGGNTKFVARDDGSLMLNTSTYDGPSWTRLFIADNTLIGYCVDSYQDNPSAGAGGLFRFGRGSQSSKAVVQTGDRLGFFIFSGFDGSNFHNSAGFTAKVDGTVSTGSVPTKLVFETGTSGPPNRYERMVISSSGNVGIGTPTPTQLLDVNSNGIRIRNSKTPASSSDTCNQGDMAWDSNYVYVCISSNLWKRASLGTW